MREADVLFLDVNKFLVRRLEPKHIKRRFSVTSVSSNARMAVSLFGVTQDNRPVALLPS